MKMSRTARCPFTPSASNTITPISIVSSTDAIGATTIISRLGLARFSSLSRMVMQLLGSMARRFGIAMDAAHQQADLLDVRLRNLHRLGQPARINHSERVAQGQ